MAAESKPQNGGILSQRSLPKSQEAESQQREWSSYPEYIKDGLKDHSDSLACSLTLIHLVKDEGRATLMVFRYRHWRWLGDPSSRIAH